MKALIFNSILIAGILASCMQSDAEKAKPEPAQIQSIIEEQSTAWNNGNLEAFMEPYWQSDSLRFTGGKSITFGWQQALDRYKKSYPDKATMGVLSFSDVLTKSVDDSAALTTGQWAIQRDSNAVNGRFTLVWRYMNGTWKIIADHSS